MQISNRPIASTIRAKRLAPNKYSQKNNLRGRHRNEEADISTNFICLHPPNAFSPIDSIEAGITNRFPADSLPPKLTLLNCQQLRKPAAPKRFTIGNDTSVNAVQWLNAYAPISVTLGKCMGERSCIQPPNASSPIDSMRLSAGTTNRFNEDRQNA